MRRLNFWLLLGLGLGITLTVTACRSSSAETSGDGEKAQIVTNFEAPASLDGQSFTFSLKEALAKGPVVVYFFPSAYTGGCDIEAHTFAEMMGEFEAAGASVIGISADNIDRLNSFSKDPDFCSGKFPVASDPDGAIASRFGLEMAPEKEGAKDVNGDAINHGFLPRETFVLDKSGKIVKAFSSEKDGISPAEHVTQSLDFVKTL